MLKNNSDFCSPLEYTFLLFTILYYNLGTKTNCHCGLRKYKVSERIVGGEESGINEFPWMVNIEKFFNEGLMIGYQHICGGSLISDQWILSAAHCFWPSFTSKETFRAILGDHNIRLQNESEHITIPISRIISHKEHNKNSYLDYDFALVKMKKKVNYSLYPHIRPICLPRNNDETYENKFTVTTGWGVTENDQQSDVLLKVNLKIMANEDCESFYRKASTDFTVIPKVTDRMICARSNNRKDACEGDSGKGKQLPK